MNLTVDALEIRRTVGTHLLGPIDLCINRGERWALVGESGSGKSLLAQALFGVLPPGVLQTAGSLRAFGAPLGAGSPEGLRGGRLGWVPQEPLLALNPLLTLGEHLALLPAVHRNEAPDQALARLRPLLDCLGLPRDPGFLDRLPHQASGGERQRICLAMALSCDPDLLVLDEPTTALDAPAQRDFAEQVRLQQRERGLGYLWITHDLALAALVADRLLVLQGGHLVEAGPTERLLRSPRHPCTARLLEAARRQSTPDPGFLEAPSRRGPGCPFQPRCDRVQTGCRNWGPWRGSRGDGLRCEAPLDAGPRP